MLSGEYSKRAVAWIGLKNSFLTLPSPSISESCIKIKALKAFIKPFEAPQGSVKIKTLS